LRSFFGAFASPERAAEQNSSDFRRSRISWQATVAYYQGVAAACADSADDEAKLRDLVHTLSRRDRVEAIVLTGTDLNLVFNEVNAGFPAVDCAAAHIDAIVAQMAK
jgi:aspartate/glutamate racemase